MASPDPKASAPKTSVFRSTVFGVLAAGAVATVIFVSTLVINGKSTSIRALTDLAMPVGLLWLFLIALTSGLWRSGHRRQAMAMLLIAILFSVLFNGRFAGKLMRSVEYPPQPNLLDPASEPPNFDAIISLGGSASMNRFGVPELGGDGQRLLLAAQLWHAGKAKRIICTGSSPTNDAAPSLVGRQLLESVGVPPEVIFEIPGENTSGEMRYLKEALSDQDSAMEITGSVSPKIGLVTSAAHMPRAMRLAESEGLTFQAIPCAYSGSPPGDFSPREIVPTAGAAKSVAIALKEYLARLAGQ